jgi:hypothetical protein
MPQNNQFSELRLIASPQGFAVYDGTRKKLEILAMDVFVRPGQPPFMQIALPAGNVDVAGKALYAIVDPTTGKPRVVRRIEWADGESVDYPVPEKSAESAPTDSPKGNGQAEAEVIAP